MKKLIIHIGYHKTASTSLQLNFFADLHKDGKIEYLSHLQKPDYYFGNISWYKIYREIINNDFIDFENFKDELELIAGIDKDVSVISAETLSTFYPGHKFSKLLSNATQNAERLKLVFEKYFDSIEILIGIRSQIEMIRACNKQWYHLIIGEQSESKEINKWLTDNFNNEIPDEKIVFNYQKMISHYRDIFGKTHVHVLIYEDLIHNKPEFYDTLSKLFNVENGYVQNSIERQMQNVSKTNSKGQIEIDAESIGQRITRPFRHIAARHLTKSGYVFTKKVYNTIVPKRLRELQMGKSVAIRQFTEAEKVYISERFQESNITLVRQLGLDINKMRFYKYIQ